MAEGEAKIWIKQAIFERDVNSFFAMHPKYVINHKDLRYESEPAEGGGKAPKWMAEYLFDVGTDLETAGVMDFTFLESDDLIASAEISIKELVEGRDEENGVWLPVMFESAECGKFHIVFKYGAPAEPAVPAEDLPADAPPSQSMVLPSQPSMVAPTPGMPQ